MNNNNLEAEKAYAESLSEPLEKADGIGVVDIVVGIPFQNEATTIGHVCQTVAKGLSAFFPDRKCVLVCVGALEGEDALNVIQEVPLGSERESLDPQGDNGDSGQAKRRSRPA